MNHGQARALYHAAFFYILAVHKYTSPYSTAMPQEHSRVKANAHPEAEVHDGEHSSIPHPPPEDHYEKQSHKPTPDTGWTGPIPSQQGGDTEQDFLTKPPYSWASDKFVPKYVRRVSLCGVTCRMSNRPIVNAGAVMLPSSFTEILWTQNTAIVVSASTSTARPSNGLLSSQR